MAGQRSQRVTVVSCGAVMSTLVVWGRESGAASSPLISTGLLLLLALGLLIIVRQGRKQSAGNDDDSDRQQQAVPGADQRPRAFADIPRGQRQRLIIVISCTTLLFLLVAPLVIVSLRGGMSLLQALPMLVILAMAVVAVAFTWRQVRHPTAQTLSLERQRPRHVSRRITAYLIFVPAFALAGLAYQALATNQPLAVTSAFVINLGAAALILLVDERLARRQADKPRPADPPVW